MPPIEAMGDPETVRPGDALERFAAWDSWHFGEGEDWLNATLGRLGTAVKPRTVGELIIVLSQAQEPRS